MPDYSLSPSLSRQVTPPQHLTAPQRLWAAVLDSAIMSLEQRGAFNYGKKHNVRDQKRKLRDESLTWLKSDLTTPGSFIFICDTLLINPDFLRERLLKKYAVVPWNNGTEERLRRYHINLL